MRKTTPEGSSNTAGRTSSSPKATGHDDHDPADALQIELIRPDGSVRDITLTGHFREVHLCTLVDEELCRLDTNENLIIHLYHSDGDFTRSLRSRWQEGLSDNRRVFVREVLGPSDSLRQLDSQMEDIHRRISAGEKVNLAIRSPIVALAAREKLRHLLLSDQQVDGSRLNVWVFGSEDKQQEILEHLGDAGMVRARDSSRFVEQHPERRWRLPWIKKHHHRHRPEPPHSPDRHIRTPQEAVAEWIRRVEESRELSQESEHED